MKNIIAFFLLTITTFACNHFDGEELETQFAFFRSAHFNPNNLSGFENGQIPDMHVIVDGKTTAILRLPQTMPWIPIGTSSDLIILPAIPLNGIKSNTQPYPLVKFIEKNIERNINYTDTIDVLFDYKEDVKFNILEGFEFSNTISYPINSDMQTVVTRTSETAFEGNYAGKIHLTKEDPIIHIANDSRVNISSVTEGIYLELTYKGNVELFVGLAIQNDLGIHEQYYKLFLSPKDDWNTVFIDLTNEYLSSFSSDIRLLFGAELDTNKQDEGDIFIDNIKLLHL